MLRAFDAVKRRVGLQRDARDLRVQLLQSARRAHKSSAGPKHGDEVCHPAFGLPPDFVSGSVCVVRAPVGIVRVLIGIVIAFGIGGGHLPRLQDRAVGAFAGIGINDLGTVSPKNPLPLRRNVGWHTKCHWNAIGCAQHGIGNPRIAAGGVQQSLARSQFPRPQSFVDNIRSCTIFDRAAGVVPLRFCEHQYAIQPAWPNAESAAMECYQCALSDSCPILSSSPISTSQTILFNTAGFRRLGRKAQRVVHAGI